MRNDNPLMPTVAIIMGTLTLRAERQSAHCPDVKNHKWRLNPVWHRMLYSI